MKHALSIEVRDDGFIAVTGDRTIMKEKFPLPDLFYLEVDGMIQAMIYDPVPFRGRQIANAAVRRNYERSIMARM